MAKLTPKQQRFCEEYLIDLNATQAAIRAGYSPKTADRIGPELLGKTCVAATIQESIAQRSRRTEITQDWVLEQLRQIAAADRSGIARVVTKERPETVMDEETGEPVQVSRVSQFVEVSDTDELDEDQRAALAGVEETKHGIKVSTYDKLRALELLGKHLGMFTDKIEHSGAVVVKDDKLDSILEQLNE